MPKSEVDLYYNDEGKLGGDGKINKSILKITTWNLNSILNVLNSFPKEKNPLLNYIKEDFDFLCMTETHLKYSELNLEILQNFLPSDYIKFYNCHKGDIGRSGVATFTKHKPISVFYDLGVPEHDLEGRIITLEYDNFYLVNCYTPNSGRELQRLEYRTTKWDPDFRAFLKKLNDKKHVILCGDLNVAHTKIDVHVQKRYAGATDEERAEFSLLLKEGFVDAFRYLYPKDKEYTFFSSYFDARSENKGWRLDYYVVDNKAIKSVKDVKMRKEIIGSDHCPMEMVFDLSQLE